MALTPDACRRWLAASRCPVNRFDRTPEPFGVLLWVGLAVACGAWAAITGRA
jgi:hypothetical protein